MSFPLIVTIKRDSHEDGPGIRSVVFFKGCPLRCVFCQNPESQATGAEIAFSSEKCRGCGLCETTCPNGAIFLDLAHRIQRQQCGRCGECARHCPTGALRTIGRYYHPDELVRILLEDKSYYLHSGGGVTLSGGEATLFPDYCEALLNNLKSHKIHILVQTCGYFDYSVFRSKMLPYLDTIYFDLKIADEKHHRLATGLSNKLIFANLTRLVQEKSIELVCRIPLVPTVTDSPDNLEQLVDLLVSAGVPKVQLLPYNPLGMDLYEGLGRDKPHLSGQFMKIEELISIRTVFQQILAAKARSRNFHQDFVPTSGEYS